MCNRNLVLVCIYVLEIFEHPIFLEAQLKPCTYNWSINNEIECFLCWQSVNEQLGFINGFLSSQVWSVLRLFGVPVHRCRDWSWANCCGAQFCTRPTDSCRPVFGEIFIIVVDFEDWTVNDAILTRCSWVLSSWYWVTKQVIDYTSIHSYEK